jgi:assimilatory nitrate reductase catalytic subunit
MLHAMMWEGLVDRAWIAAHTSGFEVLRDRVRDYAPKDVAALCGIEESALLQAARWFAGVRADTPGGRTPTLSLYCQGLNQSRSGTMNNAALINLHLATGQIGRPGAGPLSLTGQPNAMGGREVGGMANLLERPSRARQPGIAPRSSDCGARRGAARCPRCRARPRSRCSRPPPTARSRRCGSPARTRANRCPTRRPCGARLQRAEFVVVQEAFATTATCAYADLLLPATTWGEKDGTVTNSERRISRVRPAVVAPGKARHDWRIATGIRAAARGPAASRPPTLFPTRRRMRCGTSIGESTPGRDSTITGLTYARLRRAPGAVPVARRRPTGQGIACTGTASLPDGRLAAPRFADTPSRAARRSRATRVTTVLAEHRPAARPVSTA